MVDFLVSSETCALEYMTRLARYLIWRLDPPLHSPHASAAARLTEGPRVASLPSMTLEDPPDLTRDDTGRSEVLVAVGFVLQVADRIEAMRSQGLLPFDLTPLLSRVRQLRAAVTASVMEDTTQGLKRKR